MKRERLGFSSFFGPSTKSDGGRRKIGRRAVEIAIDCFAYQKPRERDLLVETLFLLFFLFFSARLPTLMYVTLVGDPKK